MGDDVRGKGTLLAAVSVLGLSLGVSAVAEAQPALPKKNDGLSMERSAGPDELAAKGVQSGAASQDEGDDEEDPDVQNLTGAVSNQDKTNGRLQSNQNKLSGVRGLQSNQNKVSGVRGLESLQQKFETNQRKD